MRADSTAPHGCLALLTRGQQCVPPSHARVHHRVMLALAGAALVVAGPAPSCSDWACWITHRLIRLDHSG